MTNSNLSEPVVAENTDSPTRVDIVLVGAGFSGVGAAIKLAEAQFDDFIVLERGDDVGGTWRDNSYPGAACDVPSHLYSYSFAPNPEWSRSFSPQGEIHDYIRRTAEAYGVRDKIKCGVDVQSVNFDPVRSRWTVSTSAGVFDARVVVLGVGALCEPKLPAIPGIESFTGSIFHSACWDHSAQLDGQRAAVIGTGASAIQIVPAIADQISHLDVYQRTPPWILPRVDRVYTPLERLAVRKIPGLQRAIRGLQYLTRETQVVGLTKSAAGRLPIAMAARAHIRAQVRSGAMRKKVTPDYEIGCKRILLSNRWYPTLQRSNVDLITAPITKVTESSVVTADGVDHPTDVLVVATGFRVTDNPFFTRVHGSDGRSLAQVWGSEGMEAYKGTTVAGFPNLFVLVGPATGLGHSSMIYMIESQLAYLVDGLTQLRDSGVDVVEVSKAAQTEYNQRLRQRTADSVWLEGGCSSWYMDAFGNAPAVWPDYTFRFRAATKEFDLSAYHCDPEFAGDTPERAVVQ